MTNWKEKFDKEINTEHSCGNPDEHTKDFISKEIIEKLIDEIRIEDEPERLNMETRAKLVDIRQQLRDKWLT